MLLIFYSTHANPRASSPASRGFALRFINLHFALATCEEEWYSASDAINTFKLSASPDIHSRVSDWQRDGVRSQGHSTAMAGASGYTLQFKELNLSDTSCAMGGSSEEWEALTVPASEPSHATSSSSSFLSACCDSIVEASDQGQCSILFCSSVEEQIEQSKPHWSTLAESYSDSDDEEVAEVSNVEAFEALHSKWGDYLFSKFIEGEAQEGWSTLQVGGKFAEGGQAELFHVQVTWAYPGWNEALQQAGIEWALKVFKKGTFLRRLQSQLPHGLFRFKAEKYEEFKTRTCKVHPRVFCDVFCGTLLADGRFAFLMQKEDFDLRTLLEHKMKLRGGGDCGPFSKEDGEHMIIYQVAMGLHWLHSHDIVHRDLKASNVLVRKSKSGYPKWNCLVADYECSVGIVGTGFFRAPEILKGLKDGKLKQRLEVFSKAADVYSFGMTCYEILTGKLPFGDHPQSDYDLVISGQRPVVPEYVEDWTRELLSRCWQSNPKLRPTVGEILDLVSSNSSEARIYKDAIESVYG